MDEYPREIEDLGTSIEHWCTMFATNHHRATQGLTNLNESENAKGAAELIYERMRSLGDALAALGYHGDPK